MMMAEEGEDCAFEIAPSKQYLSSFAPSLH